jgi:acetyl esterase
MLVTTTLNRPILFSLCSLFVWAGSSNAAATSPAKPNADMQKVLTELGALGGKPIETLTPAEARQQPTPTDAVQQVLKKEGKSIVPEAVAQIRDIVIPTAAGNLPARVYSPSGKGPFPVTVYYHGGGWVIGSLDVYDSSPRAMVNLANTIVVSVAYRLSPESKFPAAHDDAFAAYMWTVQNAASLNGDPKKVAVMGESAGGNLAVNVSIMARDQKQQLPVYQVVVYPIASGDMTSQSYKTYASAKPLNQPMMAWFFDKYLRTPADLKDPKIDLLNADLKGLPSTTLITAQIDPLNSEGVELGKRLKAAGVRVDAKNYAGVTHEFFGMGAAVPEAKDAEQFAAGGLKTAF